MPRLLLFASVAEVAGVRETDVEGTTLREVLDAARRRFGDGFSAQLPHCRIVVNGEPVEGDADVSPADEVAILPPVAGG